MQHQQSDKILIQALLAGGRTQEQAFAELYRTNLVRIEKLIRLNGGSSEDARDIFQDGLIVMYRDLKSGKFRGESQLNVYLYGICKFLWYNERRRRTKKEIAMQDIAEFSGTNMHNPQYMMESREKKSVMLKLVQRMGQQCREVLMYAIYYEWSMEDIAAEMKYKSAQIVRNKKYKCLKKLMEMIQSQSGVLGMVEDFRS